VLHFVKSNFRNLIIVELSKEFIKKELTVGHINFKRATAFLCETLGLMWLPDSGVFVAKCSRSFSSLVVLCMWFSQPTRTENAFHCDNGQFGVAYSDNAFEALLLIVHLLWFAQSCTANSYASANAQFTLLDATGQWAAKLLSRVVSCQAGRCELVNYFECVQTAGGDRRQFASSFIPSAMKVGQTVNISLSKAGMSVYYFSRFYYSDFSRFLHPAQQNSVSASGRAVWTGHDRCLTGECTYDRDCFE